MSKSKKDHNSQSQYIPYAMQSFIKEKAAMWSNAHVNCSRCVSTSRYMFKLSGTRSQKIFKANNAFFTETKVFLSVHEYMYFY